MADVWVLIDTTETDTGQEVRICGTFTDGETAMLWAVSRRTRNAIRVPLDGLAEGEVL